MAKPPKTNPPGPKIKDVRSIVWIDATTHLPSTDRSVMIHCPDEEEAVWIGYYDGEVWRLADGWDLGQNVTAWADLPKPPAR